jgi:hypothetical protein
MVVVRVISPGVVKEVAGMCDLVIGHLFAGWRAVDDVGGDPIVGIGLGQGLGAFEALGGDISKVFS